MRCPKCQYIGFDSGDRCRNCGYEFSLVVEDPAVDLPLDEGDHGDLGMRDLALADEPPGGPDALASDDERLAAASGGSRRPLTAADLPLFTDRYADDQAPLVSPPAVPRAPLSVRRTNHARQRARGEREGEPRLDLAPQPEAPHETAGSALDQTGDAAGLIRRACAGVIDVTVLGTVAITVLVLTLRLSALTLAQWQVLPIVPFAAFLLLVCGGYFVLFTAAGGQTIGKMIARIRVVAADEHAARRKAVAFSTALIRAVACLGSVAALGAGFLPALFSADRRAFHDRMAGTRVVSA